MTEISSQRSGANMQIANSKWHMLKPISDLRLLISGFCALLFALSVSVEAQQPGKIFRIGFLDSSNASGMAVLVEAFRQEMSKLGWIEGKNIAIEYRFAEQKLERLPEFAADLVRLKVDLIVVSGGPTPIAAKGATSTI